MIDNSGFQSEADKLHDSLERYRKIIDSTPICIKVFDSNGKLIFLNKGGRTEHFIKDTDDITKWDWLGTIKKEYQSKVLAAFQQSLKGQTARVVMEHTPLGSKHAWCEGVISPIRDETGKITLVLFYSIDITEKKRAELELEKMNQLMIGRELRIKELKDELAEVKTEKVVPDSKE
ncbi:hypothetical protein A2783_00305 [Microgenomates group bacterium RIFCSPHIGHO2_01_FULL_45_11]|nr:MAG: hypothetical protein A2783_00305 [Microgenomates group bacterium RIFCSPHIGHO2_01_FULL_45_11]